MDRINPITARFESAELEHRFRQEYLAADKKKIYIVMALVAIYCLTFVYSDLRIQEAHRWINLLLTVRFVGVCLTLIFFLICRRSRSEDVIDRTVLAGMISFSLFNSFINCTRPSDYYLYLFIDLVNVFTMYLYVPNRLIYQVFSVTFITVSEVVVFLCLKKIPDSVSMLAIIAAFLAANFIGLFSTHNCHVSNRRAFSAWLAEKKLRQRYEDALGQIKTLSGLLPICSSCKRIRDDQGDWKRIEVYISEHSQAEFTHGLCPDCARRLYPGFSEKL
ncbi:hypothetical protein LLH00_09355 [bacterium]|nr:hypothetical protein [bacterium]